MMLRVLALMRKILLFAPEKLRSGWNAQEIGRN